MYLILFTYLLIGSLEKQQLITTHNLLIVMRFHTCRHLGMMQDFKLRYVYVSYSIIILQCVGGPKKPPVTYYSYLPVGNSSLSRNLAHFRFDVNHYFTSNTADVGYKYVNKF